MALVGPLVGLGVWLTPDTQAAAQTLTVKCQPALPDGTCDESGDWQKTPVTITWQADPVPTHVTGCDSQTYTDAKTTAYCAVSWGSATQAISFPLNVESSNPTATATPARPPDADGWYNRPVAVSFEGSAFSGIASCTPAQTYGGPDTGGVALSGTCYDNAGKAATAGVNLPYDATAPSLAASAQPGDGSVGINWQAGSAPAPLASLQVTRSPGLAGAATSALYQGNSGTFLDTRVRNGSHYTYTITATDEAGNVTVRDVVATPGPRVLSPTPGAHTATPPLLTWTPVPEAKYYNVQLYRGGKILSRWPTAASLQLPRTWRFGGRRHRLRPGRYRWYVWPGFGARKAARYGHMVGTATFVVT